ncbi:hypothetical protein K437DRAFT_265500 [Tilletiaria anomala UBC 951]|uniref:Secreted protein n=1 Tax=Tilletiaria anomala (strain ATCC 24038 / CBS 436.72 / UBC 951) TaxID=1037660 RepID=A0A066V1I1_TILAU|nr:uncharacterized protein K437DRAFT_265500 [Tilletiaria anomala UBC 951]KDN35296.1 hypothetical protein K437DRAFT_265500 [Tilletiaria anomala UBC 951]
MFKSSLRAALSIGVAVAVALFMPTKGTIASPAPVSTNETFRPDPIIYSRDSPNFVSISDLNSFKLISDWTEVLVARNESTDSASPACATHSRKWTERQRTRGGNWWNQWTQITSCLYCGQNSGSQGYSASRTVGWSISFGASMSYGDVKSVLPNPSFGFSYTDTSTYGQSSSCNCQNSIAPKREQPGSIARATDVTTLPETGAM